MWSGGHPGTGDIIRGTGDPGGPITGIITTVIIITGMITTTATTVTGTVTAAGIIHPSTGTVCEYTVPRWQ